MTKRIVTLLLAVVFVVSSVMLVACQQKKEDQPSQKSSQAAQSSPAKPTESEKSTESEKPTESEQPTEPTDEPTESSEEPTDNPPAEEPEFGTSEWVSWLVDVDFGDTYNRFLTGSVYNVTWNDDDDEEYVSSAWEVWRWDNGPVEGQCRLHMCYMFDRNEIDATANCGTEDYQWTWEIWYRDAEDTSAPYKKIVTAPWSVYNDAGWTNIIYRIPTYGDGMKDLVLPEGETSHDYEMVFIIYDGENDNPENIVGWKQDYIPFTNSTVKFQQRAVDSGVETAD